MLHSFTIGGTRLDAFASWADVLAHVASGAPVYYHAPMDRHARRVDVKVKGPRVRVDPQSSDADPFWADARHLDRFRRIA